jgi:hypothetical protein
MQKTRKIGRSAVDGRFKSVAKAKRDWRESIVQTFKTKPPKKK